MDESTFDRLKKYIRELKKNYPMKNPKLSESDKMHFNHITDMVLSNDEGCLAAMHFIIDYLCGRDSHLENIHQMTVIGTHSMMKSYGMIDESVPVDNEKSITKVAQRVTEVLTAANYDFFCLIVPKEEPNEDNPFAVITNQCPVCMVDSIVDWKETNDINHLNAHDEQENVTKH